MEVVRAFSLAFTVAVEPSTFYVPRPRLAYVVLPAAMWAEVDGVMINSERSLTLLQQGVDPPGEALPDWAIIARVACAMGYADAFTYSCAEEVFEEIRGFANPATGYGLFEAADLDDALAKAKGCPILQAGGSVELAECIDM